MGIKMSPKQFVDTYWKDAITSEKITKVPAVFTLAQAALESDWNASAPKNNFFGIKDPNNIDGKGQLLETVEYSTNPNLTFPQILSKAFIDPIKKLYKYIVKTWFKTYDTPEQSFEEHGKFFLVNARYHPAFEYIQDPNKFADMVASEGYATDPNYSSKLKQLIRMLDQVLIEEGHK